MKRARKGLSELVGALVLILIFSMSAIYTYNINKAVTKRAEEVLNTYIEGARLYVQPPKIDLNTKNSSIIINIRTNQPELIDSIIVEFINGSIHTFTPNWINGETSITLMKKDRCSPFKIIVLGKGGASLIYPNGESEYFTCRPDQDANNTYVYPGSGDSAYILEASLPSNHTVIDRLSLTLTIDGRLRKNPPNIPPTVYVNNSTLGTLHPGRPLIVLEKTWGSLWLYWKALGNSSLIVLKSRYNTAEPLIIQGKINEIISMKSNPLKSFNKNLCTLNGSIIPYIKGAVTWNSSIDSKCLAVQSSVRVVTYIKGNASAEIAATNGVVLLLITSPIVFTGKIIISFDLNIIRAYINNTGYITLNLEPPIKFSLNRPRIWTPHNSSYHQAMTVAELETDPTTVEVELLNHTTILGRWILPMFTENLTVRASQPQISMRISAKQPIPPTYLQLYNLTTKVHTIVNGSAAYQYFNTTGRIETLNLPAAWSIPYDIIVESRNKTQHLVIAKSPPLVTNKVQADVIFNSEHLKSNHNLTVLNLTRNLSINIRNPIIIQAKGELDGWRLSTIYGSSTILVVYTNLYTEALPNTKTIIEVLGVNIFWLN